MLHASRFREGESSARQTLQTRLNDRARPQPATAGRVDERRMINRSQIALEPNHVKHRKRSYAASG